MVRPTSRRATGWWGYKSEKDVGFEFGPAVFSDKYNDFIDANRIEDAEDRLKTMKKLVMNRQAGSSLS